MVDDSTTTPGTESPTKATKATVGSVVGAVIAVLASLQGSLSDNVITTSEWLGAAIAGLVSLGAVFGTVYTITNRPK